MHGCNFKALKTRSAGIDSATECSVPLTTSFYWTMHMIFQFLYTFATDGICHMCFVLFYMHACFQHAFIFSTYVWACLKHNSSYIRFSFRYKVDVIQSGFTILQKLLSNYYCYFILLLFFWTLKNLEQSVKALWQPVHCCNIFVSLF